MGNVALDRQGNMALGYSVVNATDVFPGIRDAGRLAGDPLGQLSQGEVVLQNGSGVQAGAAERRRAALADAYRRVPLPRLFVIDGLSRHGPAHVGPWQSRNR